MSGFDPAVNAEYLRKRFEESIYESGLAPFIHEMDEDEAERVVSRLVERLLIEVGAY